MSIETNGPAGAGRTSWGQARETPLRRFLRTETGSAAVVLVAALAALAWANIDPPSYTHVWQTTLSVHIGGAGPAHDLRYWVNSGLMTLFFFIAGLEVRREFDMGELRDRRRVALPLVAGLGGTVVPIAGFLIFNAGRASAHGWAITMSTDTAFALGMLAVVARSAPDRLRVFMLTVSIVDDVLALVVIATVYSGGVKGWPLVAAAAVFAGIVAAVTIGVHRGLLYGALGLAVWLALSGSGIDPIVVGLVMGLLTPATPAARDDLERASDLFRRFREQPTPELARTARAGIESAISPNERLQRQFHPWTSYLVVPLFALANAGIEVRGGFLGHALTSPVTLGVVVGSVLGKPLGVIGGTWLVSRLGGGRPGPPVGWGALSGGGTIAGIGFTVSLLIASVAFKGEQLQDAKLGVLLAAVCASLFTWLVFRATAMLPNRRRALALLGTSASIIDLQVPVEPGRDHIRGPEQALVTVVEYGDFECPYCGRAEPVVRELLEDFGDVRYVWRHLPLNDVHPHAQQAAEAAEAAAAQGAFWAMHDQLLEHQQELGPGELLGHAAAIGIDVGLFADTLRHHAGAARIAKDVDGADLSGVTGTPTFFVNGHRHYGSFDVDALAAAVQTARARALVAVPPSSAP
jgi:Na+/H+ antiporter NhaA